MKWSTMLAIVGVVLIVVGFAIVSNEAARDDHAAIVCAEHGGGFLKGGAYGNVTHALCNDGTILHLFDGEVYR